MTVAQSVRRLGQIPAFSIDDASRADVLKIGKALDGIPRPAWPLGAAAVRWPVTGMRVSGRPAMADYRREPGITAMEQLTRWRNMHVHRSFPGGLSARRLSTGA